MDRNGEEFLESVLEILKEAGVYGSKKDEVPVVSFEHPLALKDILKMSLDNSIEETPDDKLRQICAAVVRYSVKTSHRNFHNQLFAAVDKYALAGAWITEALNTSQYTFEVAPAFTLAELAVVQRAARLFGLGPQADGIFCPGGSASNMCALVAARYRAFPEVKSRGMGALPRLAIFTSEDAHYSLQKGAHWLGVGTDHLFKVRTDRGGRMEPRELRDQLRAARDRGLVPVMVNATAGTTVLGAFDPLDEVADVCQEFGVWMHVDACWGGSLMLSNQYNGVLKGIERADSVAWNPHKMLGAPLQCSLLLLRHKGVLHEANAAAACYLFQQDKFYDVSYDTGDKSVQCGRKVDAFKLWLMWRARGESGMRGFIDNAMARAEYFKNKIMNRAGFELVITKTQFTNICFWYIPPFMRNQERTTSWWEKMHNVAPKMKEKMILAGSLMIGYTPLDHKGLKNFFRVVVTCHPPAEEADMDYIINEIEKVGEDIELD